MLFAAIAMAFFCGYAKGQNIEPWNKKILLNSYRPVSPANGAVLERIDLDNDGDADVLRYTTGNGFNVQWIDDDDDMLPTDTEGDTDNDCLMVDRDKDGRYGADGDVVVDWVDADNDGKADLQLFSEFAREKDKNKAFGPGHFMVNRDLDKDDITNYIDWNTFRLRGWIHDGKSDFFEDYSGQTLFMKIHASPQNINDLRLNWENPFLFYDEDKDGLTEFTIRLLDSPKGGDKYITSLTGNIDHAAMSYDLDNDNTPANPFDFDMTVLYRGSGFDYMDQVHPIKNLRGLPEADQYFMEPRIRQLTEFIYPDHESAKDLIFNRGKWNQAWFVYDEDDDCERWERVELLDNKDPYIVGAKQGGLDHNEQSDPVGDRGEWDMDNSGKGNLYVSPLDGKIHLFGAEKGYWRVDQNAYAYQGMGGMYDGYGPGRGIKEPEKFPLISYEDTDKNGFFDKISYDLDGDRTADFSFSLKELGISDQARVHDISKMQYADFRALHQTVASATWEAAKGYAALAQKNGINTSWYALLKNPRSERQQYSFGYWLKFYLFMDCLEKAKAEGNPQQMAEVTKAYFTLPLVPIANEITAAPAAAATPVAKLPPPTDTTPSTFARFVPERADDFAWENDLIAFRTYGPALRAGAEDSGMDCWLKRVSYPILDRWYAGERKGFSYHKDHGEGYDPYHVGASRGCGGLALWKDGRMVTSDTFIAWRILEQTRERTVFELDYVYPADGAAVPISETKRITIRLGEPFFVSVWPETHYRWRAR